MRILYCTDTFLPEVNGVTTVLATMRDGLRRRGHEVFVAAPAYERSDWGREPGPPTSCHPLSRVPAGPVVVAMVARPRPGL